MECGRILLVLIWCDCIRWGNVIKSTYEKRLKTWEQIINKRANFCLCAFVAFFFLVDKIQDAAVSVLNKAVGDHFISSHRVVFSLQPTKTAFNFLRVSCSKGWQLINAKKGKRDRKREKHGAAWRWAIEQLIVSWEIKTPAKERSRNSLLVISLPLRRRLAWSFFSEKEKAC